MTLRLAWTIAAILFASPCGVRPAAVAAQAQDDILFAALNFPIEIDMWHNHEYRRVSGICGANHDCFARTFTRKEWVLNPVHSLPDSTTTPFGALIAVAKVSADGGLPIGIDYHPRNGARTTWLPTVGSWDYGINLYVVEQRDKWVKISAGPFTTPVWIELNVRGLDGSARSVVGGLFRFEDGIEAVDMLTDRRGTLPANRNYVIERISEGRVIAREEVPADMPCGGPEQEKLIPTTKTPRYRIAIDRVFDAQGHALLSPAYPRGC